MDGKTLVDKGRLKIRPSVSNVDLIVTGRWHLLLDAARGYVKRFVSGMEGAPALSRQTSCPSGG